MKKTITKKARYLGLKLTFVLFAFILLSIQGKAQQIIFTETMGTVASTTTIAAHEAANGFDNDAYTMSSGGATNPGDIRTSSASSGYTGSSGLANVWLTSTNAAYGFAIEGIDASSYSSLTVQFGYRKESGAALPTLSLDYWNGSAYVNVPFTFSQAANASVAWYLSPVINLPSGAQISNLKLRLVKTGSVAARIDDIVLKGILGAAGPPTIQAYNISFGSVAQNQMNVNWTNGDGLKRIVIMNTSNSFTDPTDGSDPTANAVYSGSGEQVVYNNSSNSFTVTGLSASTTYWFRAYEYNGSGATTKYFTSTATNNPNSQITTAPAPLITVSANSLSGFTYIYNNGPSTPPQSFTISGANLTGDISISAPTNYEISSGSGFGTSLTLTQSGGIVGNTTIYVQLKAGLSLGNYNNETIIATSADALDGIVTCSGNVTQDCTPVFPFYEDFPSGIGSLLTNNCWTSHSGAGVNPITVSTSTITYPGYLSSGLFNEVSLTTNGEDINRTFIAQNSGVVYASFLVNVSSATTTGDYFFNLGQSVIGSTYRARVFVKNDGAGNIAFGISQSTTTTINYTPFSYALGTTYLIAVRYNIVSGASNDISSIIVNPAFNTMEPTSGWYANTDASGSDLTELGSVALRQGGTTIAPNLKIDGIRISKSWSNIVGLPPAPLSYTVTGGGAYCQAGSGLPVGVSNSETGVTYELWKDGVATGLTIQGSTGNSISFGNQTIGDYTVKGTNEGGTTDMTGNAIISQNPLPTITLDASILLIAAGNTTGSIAYSATTESPTTYSIDFDATANAMGFVDVNNVPLAGGIVDVTIPAGAGAADYNANVTVKNSNGCVSNAYPIVITVAGFAFTTTQDIGTTVKVTWTSQPGAYLYAFQYRIPGNPAWIGVSAPTNSVKLTSVLPNTTYECHVRIYKNGTLWGFSQIGTFTTGSATYTKTQDIGTTAQLSWTNFAPWATKYSIQYRKVGNPAWLAINTTATSAKLTNLTPDSDYECQLRVFTSSGLWGVCQTGTFHTGMISFSNTQDIGTTLLMNWTSIPWASNFNIQYRPLGGTWMGLGTTAGQLKIVNLQPNTDYECRLSVFNGGLLWGVSAVDTIHSGTVVFTTVADNFTSMDLSWAPSLSSWATTYQMQYCIGSENPPVSWVSMTTSSNTTLTITPILSGQDYWVKMRVIISGVLWGVTKEQKIGRSTKMISQSENFASETGLNVYPNPFIEQINLEISSSESTSIIWNIYDITGKVIMSGNQPLSIGNNTLNIDASSLSKGVYVLNAIINNEKQSFRILKQ